MFVEDANTWLAKKWAYAFLKSKIWTALFVKLEVKLLYSMAYYPQTDGASKHTNQIVEIALQFFIHIIDDLLH